MFCYVSHQSDPKFLKTRKPKTDAEIYQADKCKKKSYLEHVTSVKFILKYINLCPLKFFKKFVFKEKKFYFYTLFRG